VYYERGKRSLLDVNVFAVNVTECTMSHNERSLVTSIV
jgi:hypothetical protein